MSPTLRFTLLLAITPWISLFHSTPAFAALINVTVDDQGSDPTSKFGISYNPAWNKGQTCGGCEAHPDPTQAFGSTWSDITYDPSIAARATPQNATFDFTGSAIYVFGIQSLATTDPVSGADLLFYIDGQVKGTYKFTPVQTDDGYIYNQLLFSTEGLDESSHVLGLQNGQFGGGISLVLLDYIIYSKDDGAGGTPALSTVISTTPPSIEPTPQTTASPQSTAEAPSPNTSIPNTSSPDTSSIAGPHTSAATPSASPNSGVGGSSIGTALTSSVSSSSTFTSNGTLGSNTSGLSSTQTPVSTIESSTTASSSPTAILSASSHGHRLTGGARIAVIAGSAVLGALLLALLTWCLARHRKHASASHAALPTSPAEHIVPFTDTTDTETRTLRSPALSEPAPSYTTIFPVAGPALATADGGSVSAQSEPRVRQSEKAVYIPRAVPLAGDPSLRGSIAESSSNDGGRRYTRSEFAYSSTGSSRVPLTAPPMYGE